ncbi:MAG: 5-formyltetrahydrofolate cyclo-ligase [Nocardioides sp.]
MNGAKLALRDQLQTARNRLRPAELQAAAAGLTAVLLALSEVRRAASIAAYVSVGTEPGTGALLDALTDAGKRVLLPVLTASPDPGWDLDWGHYRGPGSLAPARFGLLEPVGDGLGADAIATCDVVLVPGMAVSATGQRLGKGAGCYDRALGRVPVGTPTICLLYAAELNQPVPVEPHDRPVTHAATPDGVVRFAG